MSKPEPAVAPLVLVPAAAGKIGRYVTRALVQAGFAVRALTTRPVEDVHAAEGVESRTCDFTRSLDFAAEVEGCAAVVHLAAEIVDRTRMERVNVEATQALARTAVAAGVVSFCYVSSASVYGSSLSRLVTESSPTVDPDAEVTGQHWAPPAVRHYARTKLLGERLVSEAAGDMRVVIVRPTVVVDQADIAKLAARSVLRKLLVGRRHAHHVYVADVAAAIAWLVARGLAERSKMPSVAIYNIAEDDIADASYDDLAKRLRLARPFVALPSLVDQAVEYARYGALPWRHSLGRMMFSGERLAHDGFRFPYGLERLYARMEGSGPP